MPSKLIVANNDQAYLTTTRVSLILFGLILVLLGALNDSLSIDALALPVGLALAGIGLLGLLVLPIDGRIVVDRQSGMIEAELVRPIPFNGPQGRSRRQKVVVCPYERLQALYVVPRYRVLVGKRFPFARKFQGFRVELVFVSGDSLGIPFGKDDLTIGTHDLTMEEAGLIHQWLADAGVRVELVELSQPNGPMEASVVLSLVYVVVGGLALLIPALYTILKFLLAR
jgi:hypothetical protein